MQRLSEDDWTALHEAAHRGQTHCVRTLLTGKSRGHTCPRESADSCISFGLKIRGLKGHGGVLSQILLRNLQKNLLNELSYSYALARPLSV